MSEPARSPTGRAVVLASIASLVCITAAVACAENPPPAPAASAVSPAPAASAESAPLPFRRCTGRIDARGDMLDAGGAVAEGELHDGSPAATPESASGPVPNADETIASLRVPFRRCYQQGLKQNGRMQGCVLIRARVTPDGLVASNRTVAREGLSLEVDGCLSKVVARATFSAPGGVGATLDIPITFIQESKR